MARNPPPSKMGLFAVLPLYLAGPAEIMVKSELPQEVMDSCKPILDALAELANECSKGLPSTATEEERQLFNRTYFSEILHFADDDSHAAAMQERFSLGDHETGSLFLALMLRMIIEKLESVIVANLSRTTVHSAEHKEFNESINHLRHLKSALRIGNPIIACTYALILWGPLITLMSTKHSDIASQLQKMFNGLSKGRDQKKAEAVENAQRIRSRIESIWRSYPDRNLTWVRNKLADEGDFTFATIKRHTAGLKRPE